MTWINDATENGVPDNTQSTVKWEVGGNAITVPQPERLHITPTDAATICYHYMTSEDNSQYLLYVFQAGQFVGYELSNAVDDNPSTIWHSESSPTLVPLPHDIVIDLKSAYPVNGLTYQPRQDSGANGNIEQYSIQLSLDSQNWDAPCATGSFADGSGSKAVTFASTNARYVRLTAITEAGNRGPWSSADEILISYANGPESGADIIFSEPWASTYVLTMNNSGYLSSNGLTIDGTQKAESDCFIYQNAVPDYGCSIAIYSLSVFNAFDYSVDKPGASPMIAAIGFQGPF